ncbi:MAG: TonB system transport protein ExbD [Pseudomonadota bacterium]|jgi:biopolymer transport protein ExbD
MKRFDQINMIPFIDIMLVLLAIVLTTATFVSQGLIEVNLPEAKQVTETRGDEVPVQIAINVQNQLYIQEQVITFEQLTERLNAYQADEMIVLRIDKGVPFEQFVKVLDALKSRPFKNVSIQAQQP